MNKNKKARAALNYNGKEKVKKRNKKPLTATFKTNNSRPIKTAPQYIFPGMTV